jgi:hypothetical protein
MGMSLDPAMPRYLRDQRRSDYRRFFFPFFFVAFLRFFAAFFFFAFLAIA